jgi:cobalt-zinc-cadmium efflux system protein
MAHVHQRKQDVTSNDTVNAADTQPAGFFAAQDHRKQLTITLALTLSVFIAEVIGAIATRSLALFVDAGHMLTDITVLTASTVTAILMRRKPTATKTWGWVRLEVLTAAGGAIILCCVGIYACVEAILRLMRPDENQVQEPRLLLFFGLLGLAANLGSLVTLRGEHDANLNMRAAFLEVLNDALGSVAVVLSALVMVFTGWNAFDAVAGGVISLLMIPRGLSLLINSVKVLLEEAPEGLDLDLVRQHLLHVEGVVEIHDLHATTVATGLHELTAHVIVRNETTMAQAEVILRQLQTCLRTHFPVAVQHTTFQIETLDFDIAAQEQLDM